MAAKKKGTTSRKGKRRTSPPSRAKRVDLEGLGPELASAFERVLDKHGFAGSHVLAFRVARAVAEPPATVTEASNMCRRWRCRDLPDGSRECEWVWEPC